ncbi:hypothetical protein MMC31_002831 [Peltigera leucophlebia]|nr:hypothetical protein [Peltigera leucophlebia]
MQAVGPTDVDFPTKASRAIASQVILGLSYLHSLGVCHGDLNLNNILLHRPFQGLSVKDMYKRYHMPYKMVLHRADNAPIGPEAPSYVVHSMAPIPSHEITSCRIKISDLSSAFMVGHEPKYASTTLPVTPPEALFEEK